MSYPDWQLRESAGGLDVPLHVQPRASRTEMTGLQNGAMKIRLTAPPVDDAANRAVVEFFSSLLDIPKSFCEIRMGLRSRHKVLRIQGMSREEFLRRLPLSITALLRK